MSDVMIDGSARRSERPDEGTRRLRPDFKKALPAAELPSEVAAALERARVDTDEPYELDDLPDIDEAPGDGSSRA